MVIGIIKEYKSPVHRKPVKVGSCMMKKKKKKRGLCNTY